MTSSVPVAAALTALRKELPAVLISELLTASKLDLLGALGSLSTDGRRMGLQLWKYPKAA